MHINIYWLHNILMCIQQCITNPFYRLILIYLHQLFLSEWTNTNKRCLLQCNFCTLLSGDSVLVLSNAKSILEGNESLQYPEMFVKYCRAHRFYFCFNFIFSTSPPKLICEGKICSSGVQTIWDKSIHPIRLNESLASNVLWLLSIAFCKTFSLLRSGRWWVHA